MNDPLGLGRYLELERQVENAKTRLHEAHQLLAILVKQQGGKITIPYKDVAGSNYEVITWMEEMDFDIHIEVR